MSLKLLKLRLKIFFLTIIGQIKQQRPKVKLNQDEGSNSKILIIFPSDEPSFRVACYSFRNIGNNTNRKNDMIFLVNNQFKDIFHFGFGKTIYINNTKPSSILSDDHGKHWGFTGTFVGVCCQDLSGQHLMAEFTFLEMQSQ